MKKITAKFNSKCSETGVTLKRGDTIYYDTNSKKVYHLNSNKAKEIIESNSIQNYISAQENAYFDRFSNNYYNF